MVDLAEWAQTQHVHPQTAYRWSRQDRLPVPARRVGGLIMVGDLGGTQPYRRGRTVVHARASSAGQKADLGRQVARATAWATSNGRTVDQVVTEAGPALNGKQHKSLGILGGPEVTTIIVGHRDRFARFGAEYVAAALAAGHRQVVVVDGAGADDGLVRDMTRVDDVALCPPLRQAPGRPAGGQGRRGRRRRPALDT